MNLTRTFSNVSTTLKTYSPEIMVGAGIIMGIGSIVTAVMATPKAIEAKKKCDEERAIIVKAKEDGKTALGEDYTEADYKKDIRNQAVRSVVAVGKNYILPACLGLGSITLNIASVSVLRNRYTAVAALATTTTAAFAAYRENVIADAGKVKDMEYLTGSKLKKEKCKAVESHIEATEEGEKTVDDIVPYDTVFIDSRAEESLANSAMTYSPYTVIIDERNPIYASCNGNPYYMATRIDAALATCNRKLWSTGKIRLIDILDELEVNRRTYGDSINWEIAEMVGMIDAPEAYNLLTKKWEKTPGVETAGDEAYGEYNHRSISFGNFDDEVFYNGREIKKHVDYIGEHIGQKAAIYLDISCDGVIANKLIGKNPK